LIDIISYINNIAFEVNLDEQIKTTILLIYIHGQKLSSSSYKFNMSTSVHSTTHIQNICIKMLSHTMMMMMMCVC